MNSELRAIAVKAGAPEEVLNTLWFNVFCQKFAHELMDLIEQSAMGDE